MAKIEPQNLSYDDIAGVRITPPNGEPYDISYSAAKQTGLYKSPAEFATNQGSYGYVSPLGELSRDFSKMQNPASITLDEDTGKITVNIPEQWKDDAQVKKYVDNYILKTLSGNYKHDKNTQYQDPYDETKQVGTKEYIDKLNEALKFRTDSLYATAPMKTEVISRFGGTQEKNNAINNMSTEDIIIMNSKYNEDTDWIPIPAYMLLAYPQLADMETFNTNDYGSFIQRGDFLENFYNIENGKITERLAYGIATAPKKVLDEVEDMDPTEIAKTIAFGNFISSVDPKRSNWQQFLQAGDALSRGFYGGVYNWVVDTTDLVANAANFSWVHGNSVETKDFIDGFISFNAGLKEVKGYDEFLGESVEQMVATNKDALSKAQAGYVQGVLAGKAVDFVASMVAIGEVTKAATNAVSYYGANKLAGDMAATVGELSSETGIVTGAQGSATALNDLRSIESLAAGISTRSNMFRAFFGQTLLGTQVLYQKMVGATAATLLTATPAQIASIVNSAARVATMTQFANTAIGVLGTMTFAAVVGNKELTTKVLSGKATSDEVKGLLLSMMWDTAKMETLSLGFKGFGKLLRWGSEYNPVAEKILNFSNQASQKVSQYAMKFADTASHPWLTFMKWYLNNKAAAAKVSNARVATEEAIKEAVLMNEMRSYMSNLSTEPGSYGEQLIKQALADAGLPMYESTSEALNALAKAGVVFDPATLNMSEFEGKSADYVAAQNELTNWSDVAQNVSLTIHELNDPNIEPVISQQLSELNNANADLLKEESSAGMLTPTEIKANKKFLKESEGFLFANHSPELARYIVRKYELDIIRNDAIRQGVTDLENYQPYIDAKERLIDASEFVPENIRNIADTRYLPALRAAEHSIVDRMVDDHVYPRAYVDKLRAGGKFGKNGKDWIHLIAKKDVPKGAYTPFSKTTQQDNTIALGNFKVLSDDQITWPGNGLQELLTEYGVARAERNFVKHSTAVSNYTTETVVSGEQTAAAGEMDAFKNDLNSAVKQGFKSFVEDVEGTTAIGKKRVIEQKAFYDEVATTGGVQTADIDALRSEMKDNGVITSDTITSQSTLDDFYAKSTPQGKKLIDDTLGAKRTFISPVEEEWGDMWNSFSPNVKKILKGELEKTSLQTGYGIKDTRARLNAQVPGADVLDWSLLGRDHTNGLVPGGLYAGKNSPVKAYIMSVDDLAKLAGYDLDNAMPGMGKAIEAHINTKDTVPILPAHIRGSGDGPEIWLKMRWGHNSDSAANWTDYLKTLKERGIEKVPVAIDDARGDYNTTFYRVRNTGIAQKGLDNIVEALDKAMATGKSPEFTVRDISAALHVPGWTRAKLRNRILRSGVRISGMEVQNALDEADEYNWSEDEELNNLTDNIEAVVKEKLGYAPQDITAEVQQAFSENGQIPFFRGQSGLGEFNMNEISPTKQVGDAYWIAPNASYTDSYGKDKIMGTIPVKYFMSDKEKSEIVKKLSEEENRLVDKATELGKKELLEKNKKVEANAPKEILSETGRLAEKQSIAWNFGLKLAESSSDKEIYIDKNRLMYELEGDVLDSADGNPSNWETKFTFRPLGKVWESPADTSKAYDKGKELLSKKDLRRLRELQKLVDISGTVSSYRALAEYAKKPVIDISEDGFADGTAFFYYKGVNPKFDEEVGKQLETQARGTQTWPEGLAEEMFDEWATENTLGDFLNLIKEEAPESADNVDVLLDKLKNDTLKGGAATKGPSPSRLAHEISQQIEKKHPGLSHLTFVLSNRMWTVPKEYSLSTPLAEIGIDSSRFYAPYSAESFLEEIGEENPDYVTPEEKAAWEAIDPRRSENIPTEPKFRQPRKVTYDDYQAGYNADESLLTTLKEAYEGEQYNNLLELKQKNPSKYENFLSKLDRANASASPKVRSSQTVQSAAELYRQNVKEFEKAYIFNEKFSYLAHSDVAPKGSLKAFAQDNNLELPDDKRPLKSKVKHALWQKVLNGEKLPPIKGLKLKSKESTLDDTNDISKQAEHWKDVITNSENGSAKQGDAKAQLNKVKKEFYSNLDNTDLFKNAEGANALKYDIDEEKLNTDIDDAIDGMMALIAEKTGASSAIEGIYKYQGATPSDIRFEFTVLSQILSKEGQETFKDDVVKLAERIVNGIIPKNRVVIKGNLDSVYGKIENFIWNKLKSRFAIAKTALESMGEPVSSPTITELLEEYREDIKAAKSDPLVIKTTDDNGEIVYQRISPTIADIYNSRSLFEPMGTAQQIFSDLMLFKKISLVDLSPRSFMKQAFSDPAMAFATTGALPGTLQALRSEIEGQFGTAVLDAMEKNDPIRRENIRAIAEREGISDKEALMKNLEAKAKVQIPFTLLNSELLRQANVSKYGNEAALKLQRKTIWQKMNSGLRKVSDKLGTPQNIREAYARTVAGEAAFLKALNKGYSLAQAEAFREHAINTATTNFRLKHTMFNLLRSSVPFLTSGISGAKSFWRMFELDPIGVTARLFNGFIVPIIYFMGEIVSDDELRKKYESLSEGEKENHIVIAIGGELVLIPVGEEVGQFTNLAMHVVETLHGENQYDFWNLMLNDMVNFVPGADLTGFTDPEMMEDLASGAPDFLEVTQNGIAKVLSSTMPPILQSLYMSQTGRDLYTGKPISTDRVSIDENGNMTIMTKSSSQFAKALANIVGGDSAVLEKTISGVIGTTAMNVLDTITSAVQFVSSGGEEGSLTTGVEKALSDIAKPFTANGYNELDRRFTRAIAEYYRKKKQIEEDDKYKTYNQKIASEKNTETRQKMINDRNNLFAEFQQNVAKMVARYRDAGGTLDKWKFSQVVSLITFEDAVRADRQFMDLNTNYYDARKRAMQTLYEMGITNPEGPSTLGYIYTDDDGKPQLAMWSPVQMQVIQDAFYQQGDIHHAHVKAIIEDGTDTSLKKQRQLETEAEQPYWDKYNSTGKLSDNEWDAIDNLRKEYNAKVVLALQDYMDTYGAMNVLSSDAVMNYLVDDVIKVPSSEEKVKGRYVSSGGGVLNKQEGFGPYYIKKIFGVVK